MNENKPLFTSNKNVISGFSRCPVSGAFFNSNPARTNELEAQYQKLQQLNEDLDEKLQILNSISVSDLKALVSKPKKDK
jgi:hypothetical protein